MQEIIQTDEFEIATVLGINFHKLTVQDLIRSIITQSKLSRKVIISGVNIRSINFACELPWYRNFLNQSDVLFCDGFGVLLGAKCCGQTLNSGHRMTCPDYIEDLVKSCSEANASIYFLAGKPGVVDKAISKLTRIAPNLKIGGHHGYFDKQGLENQQMIDEINYFKPDILYIGFGMPLQEKWIIDNINQIDAKVFLPLGACLDFYTESVYRGPKWMTDMGLEWLTRLFTEPGRLWERYIVGNPLFFYRIFRDWLIHRFIPSKDPS